MEDHSAELLWMKTKDLLDTDNVNERHDLYDFVIALIIGHYKDLDVSRGQFFQIIENRSDRFEENEEDFIPILNMFQAITG